MAGGDDLPGDAGQPLWLSFLAHTADQPTFPDRHEGAGPYQGAI